MTEVQKFHAWLVKCNNIHLTNTERMDKAFLIIQNNEADLKHLTKVN